jgi:fused signal recognition particle receptor
VVELWIALALIAVVVLGGVGFVVAGRRSRRTDLELDAARRSAPPVSPAPAPPDGELGEADAVTATDEPVEPAAPIEAGPAPALRPSFFDRLTKARTALGGYLAGVIGRDRVDAETWDDLEEALIRADVGVRAATAMVQDVRERAAEAGVEEPEAILGLLKQRLREELAGRERSLRLDEGATNVWLFVGVNGVGKTTTIGKLGKRLGGEGHRVLMAAGDTFRAAAAEQLTMWAERVGADVVRGAEGGDPSSVIFDGIQAAASRGCDVVLADTAGRLHTKTNLMDELSKVRRVAAKDPGHVTEVLLVIDATTGQNGLTQARIFTEAVEVTGVVLTKLDGSAKGGIVLAIESELGIPVKLVGLGETADDLVDFVADEFVDALVG